MWKSKILIFVQLLIAVIAHAQQKSKSDTDKVFSKLVFSGVSFQAGFNVSEPRSFNLDEVQKLSATSIHPLLLQKNKIANESKAGGLPMGGELDFSAVFFSAKHIAKKKNRYFKVGMTYDGGTYMECQMRDSALVSGNKVFYYEDYSYNIKAIALYGGQDFFSKPARFVSGSIGYALGIVRTSSTVMEHYSTKRTNITSTTDTVLVLTDEASSAHGFTAARINLHAAFWLRLSRKRDYFSRFYYGGGLSINSDLAFSKNYMFTTTISNMYVGFKFFFLD